MFWFGSFLTYLILKHFLKVKAHKSLRVSWQEHFWRTRCCFWWATGKHTEPRSNGFWKLVHGIPAKGGNEGAKGPCVDLSVKSPSRC